MKKYLILLTALVAAAAEPASAANFAVITSPPTVFNLFALVAAFGCVAGCFKVVDLVRGGLLSKSWRLFMGGFIVLALSQTASLFTTFEILVLPSFVVPALVMVATGLFLYGLFEARRILG